MPGTIKTVKNKTPDPSYKFVFIESWLPKMPVFYFLISVVLNALTTVNPNIALPFLRYETGFLDMFFNAGQISILIAISTLLIGFFITVLSVLGTSESDVMIKISIDEDFKKKFSRWFLFALMTNFLLLLSFTFFTYLNLKFVKIYLLAITLEMFFCSARVILLSIFIFLRNFDSLKERHAAQEKRKANNTKQQRLKYKNENPNKNT